MLHFMIVISPYYNEVSEYLLNGAKAELDAKHATYETFQVTGALEIPTAIKYGSLRSENRGTSDSVFNGFIALGCILRGETSHYDIVCNNSANGLLQLSLDYNIPIGNGILTCDTMDQALSRADPKQKNKGKAAVDAVFSLLEVKKSLRININ